MKYEEVVKYLKSIKNIKTKDIDLYNKKLIKENKKVLDLKPYVLKDDLIHRTYFQVSLSYLDNHEQFKFIEDNKELLNDWWHVDELCQFIKKPIDFDFLYNKAKSYVKSDLPFFRRWGYVLFFVDIPNNKNDIKKVLTLLKDDNEYYVAMAEAWLIAELAVREPELIIEYLSNSKLKYNILGKAIQKICDSFRISDDVKVQAKSLREKLKKN